MSEARASEAANARDGANGRDSGVNGRDSGVNGRGANARDCEPLIKRLALLFWEMFRVSLFVVGGGYAIVAVADEVFAKKRKWTREGELLDMLPIYQMIPGIIAGNNAVYIGRKVAGPLGSIVALVAAALPSVIIFTLVSMGFNFIPLGNRWLEAAFLGLRSALTGIILITLARMWRKSIRGAFGYAVVALTTAALFTPGVSAISVIIAAAVAGLATELARIFRERTGKGTCCRSSILAPMIFFKYGLAAFGGGYVLVPVYIQDFVGEGAKYLQIPADQFANLMALTQITPGPVGINAATYFGYQFCGVAGAALASVCLLAPSFILMTLALASLERFRENRVVKNVMAWIGPVTVALIISAAWSFAGMSVWTRGEAGVVFSPAGAAIAAFAVIVLALRRLSIMQTIFASAALGAALSAIL